MNPVIKFKLVRDGARLPQRATATSGALDIFAPEPGCILPGQRLKIPAGIAHDLGDVLEPRINSAQSKWHEGSYIPLTFQLHGLMISRSGLAMNQGIRLFWDGLIDHDYRGEICVPLENLSTDVFVWSAGERLCQIAYVPMFMGGVEESTELTPTARGTGGFGSTGK